MNEDLITLRKQLKDDKISTETIMKKFFENKEQTRFHAKVRLFMNLLVKILYVCANLIAFLTLDNVLNGEYMDYGRKWVNWAGLHETMQHDYMGNYHYFSI